jgi:hypothetical protein
VTYPCICGVEDVSCCNDASHGVVVLDGGVIEVSCKVEVTV